MGRPVGWPVRTVIGPVWSPVFLGLILLRLSIQYYCENPVAESAGVQAGQVSIEDQSYFPHGQNIVFLVFIELIIVPDPVGAFLLSYGSSVSSFDQVLIS